MRSNVPFWQEMQQDGYFESHPCYRTKVFSSGETQTIEQFTPLTRDLDVVVIGCGYGRDTALIAPRVRHVYGIDVSDVVLNKASLFLGERGIRNFTPVHVDRYKTAIPAGIDLVFSITVMQHLTRDLVVDYFENLAPKLTPNGSMVIQFLEYFGEGAGKEADLRKYEPSVSWTLAEIATLCHSLGLAFSARSVEAGSFAMWHWVHVRRPVN